MESSPVNSPMVFPDKRRMASGFDFKPKFSGKTPRQSGRIDIRRSEGVEADLQLKSGQWLKKLRVYDISLTGLSLVFASEYAPEVPLDGNFEIRIICSWGYTFIGDYTSVRIEQHDEGNVRIAFSSLGTTRVEGSVPMPEGDTAQIVMPARSPLSGYIYKDFFYAERAPFQIESIGTSQVAISITDTEILLFPGMRLNLIFALRSSTGENIGCEIQSTQILSPQIVVVNARVIQFPKSLQFDVVNHLLQNASITPETIKAAGFSTRSIANNFRYRVVRTHREYLQVLNLRRTAYSTAGKVDSEVPLEKLAAPLDPISRILAVYHGNKIVGSVAMSFPDSEDIQLDTQRALKNGYPKEFPAKSSVIEIARLCTDPDYRRGDLLLRIFQHIYKIFATSERKYLLSSTDDSLWPIYKKLGFKKTGYSYPHPYLSGIEHHIIIIDRDVPTRSRGFNPLKWNYLYRDMTDHLMARAPLQYSRYDRAKLRLYRWIGKVFRIKPNPKY